MQRAMATQVRHLQAAPEVVKELRRRSRSATIGARDRDRAAIVLTGWGTGLGGAASRRRSFPKQIDRETPPGLDLHLVADNYATHKHPKVRAWLQRHPRFTMHFTPTSSSWLKGDSQSPVIRLAAARDPLI